jgi:hypothetical protein
MTPENHARSTPLAREAYLYSRYLIDREPPEEIVERYIKANRVLGIDSASPLDTDILDFSLKHPWSIPFLDAAAGFLKPDAILRKKIYTMAAVLEASPHFTGHFLPQTISPLKLFAQLIVNGLSAGLKIMFGIPIFLLIRRRSND